MSSPQPLKDLQETEYIQILRGFGEASEFTNLCSAFFTWLIYAGFISLPSALTRLEKIEKEPHVIKILLHYLLDVPLFVPFQISPFLLSFAFLKNIFSGALFPSYFGVDGQSPDLRSAARVASSASSGYCSSRGSIRRTTSGSATDSSTA
jgi:hypothetical protein